MALDRALTSGVTPIRIMEKTRTGRVVDPGPETKKVMTKSSMDSVKARRAPPRIPGMIKGKVIRRKVCHSLAPRSLAASSKVMSKSARRALTTTATKEMLKAT